jgi:hypothetical protein
MIDLQFNHLFLYAFIIGYSFLALGMFWRSARAISVAARRSSSRRRSCL